MTIAAEEMRTARKPPEGPVVRVSRKIAVSGARFLLAEWKGKKGEGRTQGFVDDDVGEEESAENKVATVGEQLENFLGVTAD